MNTLSRRLRHSIAKVDARTMRVLVTAGATYLGRFGAGIAVLVNLPLARQTLDPELFGVWMMLTALLGFMAFADLGVGNGVLNNATRAKATADVPLLRRTLMAGYGITCAAGLLLWCIWLLWAHFSPQPSLLAGTISPGNQAEVVASFGVFAALLAINIPGSLVQRVQLGMQQGYWNGINQLISALLTIGAVRLTLHLDGGVPTLILATLGVQAFVNVCNTGAWLFLNKLLRWREWRGALDTPTVRALLRTSCMFFLLQMAAAFAFQSDAVVITQTLGQDAYGDFAVIQRLFLFISMVLNAALVGMWPAFGEAIASHNLAWAKTALKRCMAGAAAVAVLACTVLALGLPFILAHWLDTPMRPVWSLVLVLSLWTVIDACANVFAAFMNGANILRAQLILALAMAGTAFAAKWLLTPWLGPTGAVLSTIVAYCLISVPGQIRIFKQIFHSKD